MAKSKTNRLLNQSFQQGCARLRYTTFDNISKAIRDAGNLEAQMLRTRRTPQAGTD
jgi:hypothetical protein